MEPTLADLLYACRGDYGLFNRLALGRAPYWSRQEEICRSVVDHPDTLVPAGNSVGKSFVAAGIALAFLATRPDSVVLCTAPTQTQLEQVLWKEIVRAHNGARVPLGGRITQDPLKVDMGDGWHLLAYATNKVERLSGHHAPDLLAIVDEGSGVPPEIFEAIDSLNPSRLLVLGNPLWPHGPFYERCTRALEGGNPNVNLIQVASLESPDIDLARSPRGMADATWLGRARADYGESSLWWKSHVLAMFPDSAVDMVVSRAWVDLAARTLYRPAGVRRMAIDVGGGGGGDRSVICVRDDNGLAWLEWSRDWSFEELAARAARLCREHGVEHARVTYDASGIGHDFNNRLQAAGVVGAAPYRGGKEGGAKHANLRSACAWALRQRLDPGRHVPGRAGVLVPLEPFSLRPDRPDWAAELRPELQGLRYAQDRLGRIQLEPKEEFARRLRRSPDLLDALAMTFAFPHA